ncbi:HipA N-terminal domain-containing protein [Arachidicoccus ginsenosidivorans]|uniref:HipA N-terminal domain-containing protein n=1 Tax=Arachidicoccus ginsenosidivorans TaxID=496057 RepID=UPI001CEFABC4
MRAIEIYFKRVLAGVLIEENRNHYVFRYEDGYYKDPNKPAISLTMPKTQKEYSSPYLFPVFSNMLSEGQIENCKADYCT